MRFSTVFAAAVGATVANAQVDSLISQATSGLGDLTSGFDSITSAAGSGFNSLTSGASSVRNSYMLFSGLN
jgi:hypothetical protein